MPLGGYRGANIASSNEVFSSFKPLHPNSVLCWVPCPQFCSMKCSCFGIFEVFCI